MFTAVITPAFQAAGATIARVTPDVIRFAGFAAVVTTTSYCSYVFNKEVLDPFVERQADKFARWLDRRAARAAARRRARYSAFDEAEIARSVAAEVERRMLDVPAATRRRTAAQAQTAEGAVSEIASASAAAAPTVEPVGAMA